MPRSALHVQPASRQHRHRRNKHDHAGVQLLRRQARTPGTSVSPYTDLSDTPNLLLQLFGSQPTGNFAYTWTGSCGHDANCVYLKYLEELSLTGTDCSIGAGSVFGNSERTYMYGGGLFSGNTFSGWLSDPAPPPVPSITEKITYYQ